jgi:cytoskeletal protein CcmA (bactofilin family)
VLVLESCNVYNSLLTSHAAITANGFYSIKNIIYNRSASTLASLSGTGGPLATVSQFQYINADNITSTQGLTVTGSINVSGSQQITGSLNVTQGITGSLFGTSSWATNAVSASNIIITDNVNTNATFYPILSPSGSGTVGARIDTSTLSYNPSTNTLSTGDLTLAGGGNRTLTMQADAAGGTEIKLLPNSTVGYARINVGNTNAPLDFQINSVDVMRITQGGVLVGTGSSIQAVSYGLTPNLSIGMNTGSTGAVLDLRNTLGTSPAGSTLGTIQFSSYSTTSDYIASPAGIRATTTTQASSGNNGGGNIAFWTAQIGNGDFQSERMRVNSNGQVLIGLSSSLDTTSKLIVNGATTITGSLNITGSLRGNVISSSIASTTASLNLAQSNFFTLTLANAANTHISASNIQPGQTVNIRVTQGSAGTGTVSFNSAIKQSSGSLYTGSMIANAVDVVSLIAFDSTSAYISYINNFV